jgi:two-component sensor histidine kinase
MRMMPIGGEGGGGVSPPTDGAAAAGDGSEPTEHALTAQARHSMANLFQLLMTLTRMRIQRSQDPEARRQMTWLLEAMGALGVLQRRVWSPDGGDFGQFLAEMEPTWRRRCAGRPIEIDVLAAPVATAEHMASALALIVHELVTNAIDHGFEDGRAGRVRVRLELLGGPRAALIVADDGLGYDPTHQKDGALGLWLIQGLASQLRGVLTTSTSGGVTARLEFPITAAAG